jgi:voltage-gated potassium channel
MDERSERMARRFEVPMLIAALLVIPMLVIQESSWGEPWPTVADILNWGTWLAFLIEVVVMLIVVPDRRRWLRDHPIDVIVTVLSPPVLPDVFAAARMLRLARVLRLLRLAPLARRVFTLTGLRYAALLTLLTVLLAGTAFAAVEGQPDEWDGVWWAVTTMATVGYGDVVPRTDAGRVIGMFVMIVGIGFLTLLIGAVADRFLADDVERASDAVAATDVEVLREVQQLSERLHRIEIALGVRQTSGDTAGGSVEP